MRLTEYMWAFPLADVDLIEELQEMETLLDGEDPSDSFLDADTCVIHCYVGDKEDKEALDEVLFEAERDLLLEVKRISLGAGYSLAKHGPHSNPGQHHVHFYRKGDQLGAINKDGTARDRSHKVHLPTRVADGIRKNYPDFKIPKNNFIECAAEGFGLDFDDHEALTLARLLLEDET